MLKWLAVTSFALQIIIPAGCMPAALSSGWFVKLCPEGLSPLEMQVLHADHSGHQDQTVSASQYDCSFAALGDELATTSVSVLDLPLGSLDLVLPDPLAFDVVQFSAVYLSRAPPWIKSA